MSSPAHNMVVGAVVSTGAELEVKTVGFRPKAIWLDVGGVSARWQRGMADDTAHKRLANGTGTLDTSGCITPLATGFRIGADTDINPASPAQINYICICE